MAGKREETGSAMLTRSRGLHMGWLFLFLAFTGNSDGMLPSLVCPDYIYAFGDSLTDTGNAQAEISLFNLLTKYPYGESYRFPDRPCERTRFCDGRLIIDYTAQAFGFPFLAPYSRHFDNSAYSHGVNFAYSGATAEFTPVPLPTFFLGREVDNYFKFRATGVGGDVGTALHIIPEIGGNDYTYAFTAGLLPSTVEVHLKEKVIGAIRDSLEKLYAGGAKLFYIFNNPPARCSPYYLTLFSEKSPKDQYGCLVTYNNAIEDFNRDLKAAIDAYRSMWPDTTFLYYDWYAGAYEVIMNPEKYGIQVAGQRACCGGGGPYNYNPLVACGSKVGNVCADPEHTLWWDEIHFTEAFYRVMATFALSGKFVEGPPEAKNLKAACNLNFSPFHISNPNPPTCHP